MNCFYLATLHVFFWRIYEKALDVDQKLQSVEISVFLRKLSLYIFKLILFHLTHLPFSIFPLFKRAYRKNSVMFGKAIKFLTITKKMF